MVWNSKIHHASLFLSTCAITRLVSSVGGYSTCLHTCTRELLLIRITSCTVRTSRLEKRWLHSSWCSMSLSPCFSPEAYRAFVWCIEEFDYGKNYRSLYNALKGSCFPNLVHHLLFCVVHSVISTLPSVLMPACVTVTFNFVLVDMLGSFMDCTVLSCLIFLLWIIQGIFGGES